ncbi:non-ribosomal peptide synthase/polyketide synthase [Gordonia malaquae]
MATAVATIRSAALALVGTDDLATLPGLFASAAHRFGSRPAVTDGTGRTLTYTELDAASDTVARSLVAAGAVPGSVVGLATARTADVAVAILGVLKAGAAYLPIDVSHPADRLGYVVGEARPLLIVADADQHEALGFLNTRLATVADLSAPVDAELPTIDPASAAYMIFTSGSTGRPKGVVVEHRNVVALMSSAQLGFDFDENDVWTMFHSYAFDFSVWELWGPLLSGGRLVIVDRDVARAPAEFVQLCATEGVTVLSLTPSAFYQFADARRRAPDLDFALRYLVFGGEALGFEYVRRWYEDFPSSPGPVLVNMYGITETTVHTTIRVLDPEIAAAARGSDVGGGLPGLTVRLLDARLQPVPDGVPGEIYVSGPQVTRGYLGRPDLTFSRFVADPLGVPGERMYRSGDVGIYRDGVLEYVGRSDDQVQLRGFRVELGEVESALLAVDGVDGAAATVKSGGEGLEMLVGYVVPAAGVTLDPAQVRSAAGATVPGYMVPDSIVVMEALPLTVNGKLDRAALPEPDRDFAAEYVAPETADEVLLAGIFADVLGVDEVGVTTSVFDLGGNSLAAARIVGQASEELGVDVTVRDLFEAPTVRELAVIARGKTEGLPPIDAVAVRPDVIPLSLAQQRMWFINRFAPESAAYNIPLVLRIRGGLDVDALRTAVGDVLGRHEVLRTTYTTVDGSGVQVIAAPADALDRLDWATTDEAGLYSAASTGFDLATSFPIRVRLHSTADETVVVLVLHHIAFDGESFAPLVADLTEAYRARSTGGQARSEIAALLEPLPVQIADYALWQRGVLGAADDPESMIGSQLDYWSGQLDGLAGVPTLPTDKSRPAHPSYRGGRLDFDVDESISGRVAELARTTNSTPFMVAHAALTVLLAQLSADADVAVGTPIAGRGQSVLDPMIGMFVNTLVLRTSVDPDQSFLDLIGRVRSTDLGAFANADVPFESVVDRVDPVRSEAFAPLAQVWLSFDQTSVPGLAGGGLGTVDIDGLQITVAEPDEVTARVDLTVGITDHGDGWRGHLLYATDLYEQAGAALFADRFVRVLDALTADPSAAVGGVSATGSDERAELDSWSAGPAQGRVEHTVDTLLTTAVEQSPAAIAVLTEHSTLTYAEFGARVNTLARELIGAGVGPDTAVGVVIGRSAEQLIAVHAVIAAGGQYVPIDPDTPAARVADMVDVAGVTTALVGPDAAQLPSHVSTRRVDASGDAPADPGPVTDDDRTAPLRPEHAAYTLFTSGSTGVPKGVTVSHRALGTLLTWFGGTLGDPADERVLVKTPFTFDASVWELFWPLTSGATAVVAGPEGHRDPGYLRRLVEQTSATTVQFVPSVLAVFLEDGSGDVSSLRTVFTGGESLTPALLDRALANLPGASVVNQYGLTEAAVDSTTRTYREAADVVTIGAPAPGSGVLILDARLRPALPGVRGELYVTGDQLARGYASAAELTAARFVADPFTTGARMYRTGDLARWTASGEIEYLGRTDFQVKLNGQRLELEDVEATIAGAPGVAQCAAAVVGGPAGDHLVAYLTGVDATGLSSVKEFAADRLPVYMRPTVWTLLDALPLGASGKVDRSALPAPEVSAAESVAADGAQEEAVAAVFAELLGVATVSVTESFFDLGGNSLAAMRLASRVSEALGAQVSVRDVFDAPSVRDLVAVAASASKALPAVTAVDPRPAMIPLSFQQQRMWFINQFDPTSPAYNMPIPLRVTGGLDLVALRRAFADVIERHEVLRTVFTTVDGAPVQQIGDATTAFDELDFALVDTADQLAAAASTGFDVSVDRPIRVRVQRVTDDEHVILTVLHHIAADGESMRPLVIDLFAAYAARVEGAVPELGSLPVQVADAALWQHTVLGDPSDQGSVLHRQLDYWRTALADLPDVLDLPSDRPRPQVASQRGGQIDYTISAALGDRIREVAHQSGVTPFIVLHAGLSVLLARLSATDDIAIGVPVAGRGDAALDDVIGMFVNTLVLRAQIDPATPFADLLGELRTVDLTAFDNADVPFEVLVEHLDPIRSQAFAPLAQVWLSVNESNAAARLDGHEVAGLVVEPLEAAPEPAKVDLLFGVDLAPTGHDWHGWIAFAEDLFDGLTVRVFAERLVDLLDGLLIDVNRPVGDAVILTDDDAAVINEMSQGYVVDLTDPQLADRRVDGTLADLLPGAVERFGDEIAVVGDGRDLTYTELFDRVNVLARELIAAGVGPDVAVGIATPRSLEMVLAIYAVTTAGGQYVPIAVDAPADRIRYMLDVSGAAVLLTADHTPIPAAHDVADAAGLTRIAISATAPLSAARGAITDAERLAPLRLDNAAYTLFTSGSTGLPKGVTVSHRSVMSQLTFDQDFYSFENSDVYLQVLDYTFDPSVLEFFRLAFDGGRMIMMKPGEHRDPWALQQYIVDHRVTSIVLVPSMLASMVRELGAGDWMSSVRYVHTGGEALSPAGAEAVFANWPHLQLFNQYGPTEATIYATIANIRQGEATVPIGVPAWHTTGHILDSRLQPVPVGVQGELYLGGDHVARGYARRPELTAERFVADPFGEPGERLYRTGDQAMWNPNGEIEYLGRNDFQVKLRGQRIEPGEIEAVLAAAPGVLHAAVTVAATPTGGDVLVAYIAGDTDRPALEAYAAEKLMAYMQPSLWMIVDEMPLSTAGKVDRKALPAPDFAGMQQGYVEPVGDAERTLAAIVAGLLGLDRVSVTESFFALGGDSIMSIQLASGARAAGLDLSPREIFELRTVRAMAEAVADGTGLEPLDEPLGGGRGLLPLPVGAAWMIEHADTASDFADFSQSMVLRAPAGITVDEVAVLLDAVVAAHPMLSSTLHTDALGDWVLKAGGGFDPAAAVTAHPTDAAVGTSAFGDALTAAFTQASADLDPETGRLVRAALVSDPSGAGRLVVVIHHLGVDAVSWRAIIEDLVTARAQQADGRPIDLRAEATSARAWTTALVDRADRHHTELDFWLDRSPEQTTDFGTPLDRARDRVATTASQVHTVPSAVTEALLTTVPEAFHTGVDDALLAALGRAVRDWQSARDITDDAPVTVLVEGHGRYEETVERGADPRRADLSRTVGWFTSIAPVRLPDADDAVHAVKAVKEELRARPEHGIGYGVLRYRHHTELAKRPLPAVSFNYLGNVAGETAGDSAVDLLPDTAAPRLPATVSGGMATSSVLNITVGTGAGVAGREFSIEIAHPTAVLDEAAVADLADRWIAELTTITEAVADGDVGLSPSDVPGAALTQADLDHVAQRHPGATIWPLTALQHGLHFQAELAEAGRDEGAVDVYVAQSVITLGGDVDVQRLQDASRGLLARHAVLRSSYLRTPSGAVAAVVPETVDVPWTVVDGGPESVEALAAAERVKPFDLSHAPLIRFVLVNGADSRHLIVTNHHIVLDGWSGPLVLADMLALYATGGTFTETTGVTADFGDYLAYLATADKADGLAAWAPVLAGATNPTIVAPGRQATAADLPRDRSVLLDEKLTAEIGEFARRRGVTTSTVLQFAWGVLLSRITGTQTVAFGETVSGRPADLSGVESIVGLFINTLPVVVDVDPTASIADVISRLQAAKVSVLDHQHLGLPELLSLTGGGQLFDTLAVHESYPVNTESLTGRDLGGLTVDGVDVVDATHYPLTLVTGEAGASIEVKLKYLPSAFDDAQAEVFVEALRRILAAVVADPDALVVSIGLADQSGYVDSLVAPVSTVNAGRSLVDLFADSVVAFGANRAVSDGSVSVDYAELDARSSAVAASLRATGVLPGDLVAVATGRGVDLAASILGVLKVGAGYLPLDTTNPEDRLRFIVEDALPSAVIVDGETAGLDLWLSLPPQVVVVSVDDLVSQGTGVSFVGAPVSADARAYVIYTSGSTGRPKGVEVAHRDVVTLMDSAAGDFDFRSSDVWTMFHSYAFDFSVWELWGPLLSGGALVIVDRLLARDPVAFLRLCADEGVTVLSQTPSAFYQFAQARREAGPLELALRYVVFGGEELNFEYVRRWFDDFPADPAVLVNMYGITETTVHVTFRELDPATVRADDPSFVGRPLASLGLHVLDSRLRPVPAGVVGEMYVTGGQLAQGYLNRPGLSSERFVANPFGPDGSRMYRTGDLAKRVGDDVVYLGRGDSQVQLRGYRIEYGEIEAAMLTAAGVTGAAASVVEMAGRGEQLVGYVVLGEGAELDSSAVRASVGRAVPAYMVPDLVVAVDGLPLTENGKLDRGALPVPDVGDVHEEFVAPADSREAAVAAVFAEVLGLEQVGVTTSFFDLGGNSLSATRLAARSADVLGSAVSVRDVFAAPTVRDLVVATAGNAAALPPVTAVVPRPDVIPLSFAQTRMWFINQLEPGTATYNVPALLAITGDLDVDALRAALADVVARHETLRTTYPSHRGEPRQQIHDVAEISARLDFAVVDRDGVEQAVTSGFDVTRDWPMRVRWSPADGVLAVVVHHIATDGESMPPLVADVLAAYVARAQGVAPAFSPLPLQMADVAIWQHNVLGSAADPASVVAEQLGFWREQLDGLPDVLELPADRHRPAVASGVGAVVDFAIDEDLANQITEVAAQRGTTPFMVLHAALAVLLARLSATDDIAVATPVAGRGQAELDGLVGMFVNTLILRTSVDTARGFADLLDQVRAADLDALANADVPFEAVVEAVNPTRSQAFAPLAQVLLTFEQGASGASGATSLPGLTVEPVILTDLPAQRDLTITVSDRGVGDWHGQIVYARDLFDPATVELFVARLTTILRESLRDVNGPVGDVDLVTDAELWTLSDASEGHVVDVQRIVESEPDVASLLTADGRASVAEAVEAGLAVDAARPAVVFGDREVSSAEFRARVNVLARRLIGEGVGPDVAVGVCIDRSVEMLTAIHAIVVAGGQYVPIDTNAPAERARYMLETAGATTLLVSDPAAVSDVIVGAAEAGARLIRVEQTTDVDLDTPPVTDVERIAPIRPDSAMYTLFTSGSTGRPKGVTVTHRAALNRLVWMRDDYPIDHNSVFLQKTPITFDVSVWELFLPAMVGAQLVIAEPGRHGEPDYVADLIRSTGTSIVHFVPSMLSAFNDVVGQSLSTLESLRLVFTSGEALTAAAAAPLFASLPNVELHNLYGPTEAAVDVTAHRVAPSDDVVPIGRPVANTTTWVLDHRLQAVPEGVPGELYLGGVQLARAYAARADLTAERFVANPFSEDGDRLYRTGDLVRWDAGRIEYLGRTDFQVKLRGQRLELGEVEAVVASAPGVVHAAATVVNTGAGQVLVGYIAPSTVDLDAVIATVDQALPEYMRPTHWVSIDAMPLNSAGKVARRELPEPEFGTVDAVEPATADEATIAQVFAEILGLETVSVTASFFDLGGNSLSATRIAARVGEALGVDVSVRDVFDAPSVRELATAVAGLAPALPPVTAVSPRPAHIPLSFAQQRMWFINQFDPDVATYNIPSVMRLRGRLDDAALRAAFVALVERHEILRTTFPSVDGTPAQVIHPVGDIAAKLDFEVVASRAELEAAVGTGFDVTVDWPLRVRIWHVSADECVLAVVAHHIAADGESTAPLITDVLTAYAGAPFSPLDVQFADYAIWQHESLGDPSDTTSVAGRQLDYWRTQLAGLPDVLDLPADRPRPQTASQSGAHSSFTVPAELASRIESIASTTGTTPFMVLHAALSVLVSRLTATDDIAVATPVAGRGQAAVDPLIGMFVNTLVLRSRIDPTASFAELLAQVRVTDLDAFGNADVPFEVIVDAVDPARSEAFAPLAQVMLGLDQQRAGDVIEAPGGLTVEPVDPPSIAAQLDLAVHVAAAPESDWVGTLVYATDLFDAATMDRFGSRFVRLLDGLCADPDAAIADAPIIDDADRATAVAGGVGPAVDVADSTLADAVAAQIERTPDATAVEFEGRSVSYAELGSRVSTLARDLIKAGVGPDTAVAICIDRGVEMMVAIHAVIAAGGQYVPVDTAAPTDRARYMIETSQARVLLVAADNPVTDVVFAAAESGARLIRVDARGPVDDSTPPVSDSERVSALRPDNAAYTLFTSGSTGRPKGVTVSHRAILNRLRWGLAEFAWSDHDRVVQKTPYTFDVSVPELFGPLVAGATVIVARPGGHTDPDYITDLLEQSLATSVHFVPSMLAVYLDVTAQERLDRLTSLKWLFASGEALPPAVVARAHRALPNVGIHNLFGPTEAAVEVTWADVTDAPELVTIGRPVWNTSAHVLDARLRPVPEGVPGELYLGGAQVARGYAAQPGLSAERFVADPLGEPGSRLYRTGDLVRRTSGGDIEYLGRTDFQVKLRGQRIELGEIESVLAAAPGVVHAAATVATAPTGAEHLVAYISPATVDLDAVRDAVAHRLPEYMRPSVWTVLEDIALNSAGKIDRRALPQPDFTVDEAEYVAPVGDVETRLAAVVAGVMGLEKVSVTESFFALGGDSIMSIQLASAARAAGLDLSPREIFEHRTVRDMAVAVGAGAAVAPMLPELPGAGRGAAVIPPVVSWMIEHAETPSDFADFSQTAVVTAPENLDRADLERLLDAVVTAHPMLSARLSDASGMWELTAGTEFDPSAAVTQQRVDAVVGTADYNAELLRAHAGAAGRLDPAAGALVQAVHVVDPSGAGRVVLVIHHLGVDAVSWQSVIEDLVTGWAQFTESGSFDLRPEGTSARAWSAALADQAHDRNSEVEYWLDRVPTAPTSFGSPLDRTRDREATAENVLHTLPVELTEKVLGAVPEALGGSVDDVLLGALARAVRGWQNDRGIADHGPVGVLREAHGRTEELLATGPRPHRADLSRTVGWFTTIAPMIVDPSTDVVHAMKAAKEERLGRPDGGVGFGLLRYLADTDLAQRPLPSILFNFLGAGTAGSPAPAVELPFMSTDSPAFPATVSGGMVSLAALTINAGTSSSADGRAVWADFRFPNAVLDADDVRNIARRWENELAAAAAIVDDGTALGLSPSDVPGARLTQHDLDVLSAAHPGADIWSLAPLQRGLYFQSQFTSDDAVDVYVVQTVLELGGRIDTDRLHDAARALLARHRVLRSGYVPVPSGEVVAVVDPTVEPGWTEIDLGDAAPESVAAAIDEIRDAERLRPFDLASPPLLRVVLVRHGGVATLVVTNHHILLDGWSGPLAMADLLALYATGDTFTAQQSVGTVGGFADFLALLAERDRAAGVQAWRELLQRGRGADTRHHGRRSHGRQSAGGGRSCSRRRGLQCRRGGGP